MNLIGQVAADCAVNGKDCEHDCADGNDGGTGLCDEVLGQLAKIEIGAGCRILEIQDGEDDQQQRCVDLCHDGQPCQHAEPCVGAPGESLRVLPEAHELPDRCQREEHLDAVEMDGAKVHDIGVLKDVERRKQ
jgi:hypothetical protein